MCESKSSTKSGISPKFLGDQGTKKLVSHSSGLEDFAAGLADFTHNLPEKASETFWGNFF